MVPAVPKREIPHVVQFSAQSEQLSYCELDLDYLDLSNFKLEQIRGHFCLSTTPMAVGKSGLGLALTQSRAEIEVKTVAVVRRVV